MLLDRFRVHYNEERPHQGIADQTPAERYAAGWAPAGARAAPAEAGEGQPTYPPRAIVRRVASNGVCCFNKAYINIWIRYAGARVRIVEEGELVHVSYARELVRSLAPDRARPINARGDEGGWVRETSENDETPACCGGPRRRPTRRT